MRLFLTMCLLANLIACGQSDDVQIDTVFDPCMPLTIVVDESASASQKSGIEKAIRDWNDRAHTQLSSSPGSPDTPTLPIQFKNAGGFFLGLYDDENATVLINKSVKDPQSLAIIVAHELGHSFGMLHIESHVSVMNPGNVDHPPNQRDVEKLADLWGFCR